MIVDSFDRNIVVQKLLETNIIPLLYCRLQIDSFSILIYLLYIIMYNIIIIPMRFKKKIYSIDTYCKFIIHIFILFLSEKYNVKS